MVCGEVCELVSGCIKKRIITAVMLALMLIVLILILIVIVLNVRIEHQGASLKSIVLTSLAKKAFRKKVEG